MNTSRNNPTAASGTSANDIGDSAPSSRAGSRDLLLLIIETCLDADVEAGFFRRLTADDLHNLRSLNDAWRASAKLAWALHGPGSRHVRHRCELSSPPGRSNHCPFTATTKASQLEWCTVHAEVHGSRAIAICPRHRAQLAPGAAVRGHAGPMCIACQRRLVAREYLAWLDARQARMSPAVRALVNEDRAGFEAGGIGSGERAATEEGNAAG